MKISKLCRRCERHCKQGVQVKYCESFKKVKRKVAKAKEKGAK